MISTNFTFYLVAKLQIHKLILRVYSLTNYSGRNLRKLQPPHISLYQRLKLFARNMSFDIERL